MICVIIPNFNGKEHIECCLFSLSAQSYKNFEIIVVDNGSTDSSVQFIRDNFSDVEIISLDTNLGFSRAVNLGIVRALVNESVSHIVLLNNDIECDENFLKEMINSFENDEIGSVSPKMLNFFNRRIVDDAGNFFDKRGYPFIRGHKEQDNGQYDNSEYIFAACAGAAIYKRDVFDNAGLFDEDFFAFYEDVDFGFRLQLLGYKCLYNPRAICYHKRGASISTMRNLHVYLLERNITTLRIKNFPFKLLIKNALYYQLVRFYFLFRIFITEPLSYSMSAFKGYIHGLLLLPKSYGKRWKVQKKRKVSKKYIENSMRFERTTNYKFKKNGSLDFH